MAIDPAVLQSDHLRDAWEAAAALPDEPAPRDLAALRSAVRDVPGETITAIVQQTLLRRRAGAKFGRTAQSWYFTRAGLEQSSRPAAAVRRARRLIELGVTHLYDLGCGIGADAHAARVSGLSVVAVDSDPVTVAVATANLPGAEVICADATTIAVPSDAAIFVDPARRAGHRPDGSSVRTHAPERWQPPWSWVTATGARHPRTVAKAAPGIPHEAIPIDCATEWVSIDGDLVEAAVWFPGLTDGLPRRSAVLLRSGTDPWHSETAAILSSDDPQPAASGALGSWLLLPDPAIVRAGLVDVACAEVHGRVVSPGIAYITTDNEPPARLGHRFRVEDVLPARPKTLRRELRNRGIATVTIRTRGLARDPQALRRQLQLPAEGHAAELVLTRSEGEAVALLVRAV